MNLYEIVTNRRYFFVGVLLVFVVTVVVLTSRGFQKAPLFAADADPNKTKGPRNAKVVIEEYSDFQCPACQRALPVVNRILETFPGKVRVVFQHFPLDGHKHAKVAHQAAECAARARHFWDYHDRLYENQSKWSELEDPTPTFLEYAGDTGIDLSRFGTCLSDGTVSSGIYDEKKIGSDRQVASTPTFFINGERFVGAKDLEEKGMAFIREQLGLK